MNNWREQLSIPREWFIPPRIWQNNPANNGFAILRRERSSAEWQALVAADVPIVTQVDDGRTPPNCTGLEPSSSSS